MSERAILPYQPQIQVCINGVHLGRSRWESTSRTASAPGNVPFSSIACRGEHAHERKHMMAHGLNSMGYEDRVYFTNPCPRLPIQLDLQQRFGEKAIHCHRTPETRAKRSNSNHVLTAFHLHLRLHSLTANGGVPRRSKNTQAHRLAEDAMQHLDGLPAWLAASGESWWSRLEAMAATALRQTIGLGRAALPTIGEWSDDLLTVGPRERSLQTLQQQAVLARLLCAVFQCLYLSLQVGDRGPQTWQRNGARCGSRL